MTSQRMITRLRVQSLLIYYGTRINYLMISCRQSIVFQNKRLTFKCVGGAVASTPERAVSVRALAEDIVLCSWARHFTLTVPLSTQLYRQIVGET